MLHEGGKRPTAGELAQHCGVLPRDLSPLIKRTTGVTLRRYIARERLNRVKALLDDRKLMVKQVAYRSEEHTSELQSLMRISYAVFCLKTKKEKVSINKSTTTTETKTNNQQN